MDKIETILNGRNLDHLSQELRIYCMKEINPIDILPATPSAPSSLASQIDIFDHLVFEANVFFPPNYLNV